MLFFFKWKFGETDLDRDPSVFSFSIGETDKFEFNHDNSPVFTFNIEISEFSFANTKGHFS